VQVVCVWVCGCVSKKTNSNLWVWCGGVVIFNKSDFKGQGGDIS
jgi:hypothetical protein